MNILNLKKDFFFFLGILIGLLLLKNYVSDLLFDNGIVSYKVHTFTRIIANIILIFTSLFFIKKNELLDLAGLSKRKVEKIHLIIFPIVYLVVLNLLFLDEINTNNFIINISILMIYCISIGYAEELSIRGFIQSYFINSFGHNKRNIIIAVFLSSLIFGFLHLFKFDKGIYGEISQVFFAFFIGVMFGVLLLITKRIYPCIIAHALIDFAAKLDSFGIDLERTSFQVTSIENSIITVLLVSPCFVYAIFLLKKIDAKKITIFNKKTSTLN